MSSPTAEITPRHVRAIRARRRGPGRPLNRRGRQAPADVPPAELLDRTKLAAKAISRKLKPELMPFAMECAGINDYASQHPERIA